MKYLLGIDNGGTFSKAALFDTTGKQLSSASLPTKTISPKPGYVERSMEELWETTADAIKKTIEKSGVSPVDIVGVSLSGHGKGLYIVGENGKIIYNGILSSDLRGASIVEEWYKSGINKKVREKSFQEILAVQPVTLLAWLKLNEPMVYSSIKHVFSVKDYIRYRLTGEVWGEYTDFSGGNLVNLTTKAYDKEHLALFGIEDILDKLPPLKSAADLCGEITSEAAERTLLIKGTPVAAGMFDVDSSGVASGLIDSKDLVMIAGTWSINEFLSREPIKDTAVALNSMYCIPDYFLVEESSPTSAGNLEWFIDTFISSERDEYEKAGKSIYGLTDKEVSETNEEDKGVYFLPFVYGSNHSAPAKGTLIGMTSYHTRGHALRALYEGVVFSHRTHVERLLKHRDTPKTLRLAGGVTNSPLWVQMFADIMQIPIEVVGGKELGAHGAAMVAGIAVGVYKDFVDAVNKAVDINTTVYPRSEYKDIYNSKYKAYTALVSSLADIWPVLDKEGE